MDAFAERRSKSRSRRLQRGRPVTSSLMSTGCGLIQRPLHLSCDHFQTLQFLSWPASVFPLTEHWEPLAKIPCSAPKNSSPSFQESQIDFACRKSERQWKRQTLCQTSLPSNTDLTTPMGCMTLKKWVSPALNGSDNTHPMSTRGGLNEIIQIKLLGSIPFLKKSCFHFLEISIAYPVHFFPICSACLHQKNKYNRLLCYFFLTAETDILFLMKKSHIPLRSPLSFCSLSEGCLHFLVQLQSRKNVIP